MALPILDKTWFTDLNVRYTSFGASFENPREVMFQLAMRLINLPVPWTVSGSCDAAASGMDGVNRWLTNADVQFGLNGFDADFPGQSWIVLRQSAINAKFELLIRCSNASSASGVQAEIWISPTAGFGTANGGSDGGTGSRPTAIDEVPVNGADGLQLWWSPSATTGTIDTDTIVSYWQSSDGECTRIHMRLKVSGTMQNTTMIILDKPKNPVNGWSNPCIHSWEVTTVSVTSYLRFNDNIATRGALDGSNISLYLTSEAAVSSMLGQLSSGLANELNGAFDIYPMSLHSGDVSSRGHVGEIFDLWWIPLALVDADTMPLTPGDTKEFAVYDDMLMVNDGTARLLI